MEAPLTSLFHVAVAHDSRGSNHPIGRVNLDKEVMTEEQRRSLQAMLKKWKWTVESGILGKAPEYAHVIATGESTSKCFYPYRIVPDWKEQLKEEVMKLLKKSIIKPSQSAWSSPMVPVQNSDGSIHTPHTHWQLTRNMLPYDKPQYGQMSCYSSDS